MNIKNLRILLSEAGLLSALRISFFLLLCFGWTACLAFSQASTSTAVNLSTQGRNPDFSAMPMTRPVTVGTSLPATCIVGQLFFNSAAAAGSNLSACTTTNTWSALGSGGLTLPLSVTNGGNGTGTPALVAGSNITITGSWPNQTISGPSPSVTIGTSLPSTCSVGQLFFNSSATAGSNLYGCTTANTWTVVGGATLTSPLPVANGGTGTATPSLVAGSNITVSGSWPNQTISGSASDVTIGGTLPASCTIGQLFFDSASTAGSNLYGCTSANHWTVIGSATLTSPLPVANGGTGTASPSLVSGSNINVTGTWPNQTINTTGSTVTVGSSLPAACTVGQLYFNTSAAAGGNIYACTAANTWTVVGGATFTSPLPVANGGTGTATPSLIAGANVTVTGSWPNQTITASGSGSSGNATAIQGSSVSTAAPANNQALVYYGASSSYIPTSIYTLQNGLGTTTTGTTNLQVNVSMGIRVVTTTADTVVGADCGGLITYNNSAAVGVVLPQPGLGGGALAGCPITFRNYGAGTVTLTPQNSTIGGNTSQTVSTNKGCLVVSDGTNWQLGNCN